MKRISQLIPVVSDIKDETDVRFSELKQVAGNAELYAGLVETYEPLFEDGVREPGKTLQVRLTADDVLTALRSLLTRKWDAARTLDEANMEAYGDIKVDGEVLLAHVPAGHLNWLTREFDALYKVVAAIPVRDPAKSWEPSQAGLHKSTPTERLKSEKTPFRFVRAEATPHHPAQVDVMYKDEAIGKWTTVGFSGALGADRKKELLDRISQVRSALKVAREEANATVQAEDKNEGKMLFDWILRS